MESYFEIVTKAKNMFSCVCKMILSLCFQMSAFSTALDKPKSCSNPGDKELQLNHYGLSFLKQVTETRVH